MKRSVSNQYDILSEKLTNLSAVFSYRLKNLCVKADPVSLLTIEVNIEGELQKLEDCTTCAQNDDYSFIIVPNYEDDMDQLSLGILRAHPEWKQERQTMKVNSKDMNGNDKEKEVPYILCTMPEVNDDRYDILKEGVDMCYNDCKTKMDAAITASDLKLEVELVGESDESKEEIKGAFDYLKKEWEDKREQTKEEKLKEIEDAYQKWLAELGV